MDEYKPPETAHDGQCANQSRILDTDSSASVGSVSKAVDSSTAQPKEIKPKEIMEEDIFNEIWKETYEIKVDLTSLILKGKKEPSKQEIIDSLLEQSILVDVTASLAPKTPSFKIILNDAESAEKTKKFLTEISTTKNYPIHRSTMEKKTSHQYYRSRVAEKNDIDEKDFPELLNQLKAEDIVTQRKWIQIFWKDEEAFFTTSDAGYFLFKKKMYPLVPMGITETSRYKAVLISHKLAMNYYDFFKSPKTNLKYLKLNLLVSTNQFTN